MDNEYLNYVEQFKHTILTVVELEVKRRRTAAATAVLYYMKKKTAIF